MYIFQNHLKKECASVKKPCKYGCDGMFSIAELEEHMKTCPMKMVTCKHCSKMVRETALQVNNVRPHKLNF